MRSLPAALVFSAIWIATPSHADVMRGASGVDCPEGSEVASVHGGPECRASTCNDDSGCVSGKVCQERALCVQGQAGSSLSSPLLGAQRETGSYKIALAACGADGSCAYPASCETAKRCVKQSSMQRLKSSCGCPVAGTSAGSGEEAAIVVAFALAGLYFRRSAKHTRPS